MSITEAAPTYDRATRQWRLAVATTGQVIQAPDRATVEAAYLLAVAPALAARVQHCAARFPQLADRARRAGLLVAAQAVQAVGSEATNSVLGEFARVRGSGYQEAPTGRVLSRAWYSVAHSQAGYTCECIDWADGSAPHVPALGGRVCKHILAALLADA